MDSARTCSSLADQMLSVGRSGVGGQDAKAMHIRVLSRRHWRAAANIKRLTTVCSWSDPTAWRRDTIVQQH